MFARPPHGDPEEAKRLLEAVAPATATNPCDEVLLYETADAHPEIRLIAARRGVSSEVALGCFLRSAKDDASIAVKSYLSSGLYRFVRQCNTERDAVIYRVFEYKERTRPYLLRLHRDLIAEPKTYIVISSYRFPVGSYNHGIAQTSNDAEGITLCPLGSKP